MTTSEKVEFENELVRVTRVIVGAFDTHHVPARHPRVVISLTNEIERRTEPGGRCDEIQRKAGTVVFREASAGHSIENTASDYHEVIIVEIKPHKRENGGE